VRVVFLILLALNLTVLAYTRLGSESGESAGGGDSGPPIPALKRAGEGKGGPRCATLGPFLTQVGVQRAAAALVASHHGSRQHSAEAPGPSSYWVLISTKTLQDATKIGLRLRAAGVTDLVIMPPDVGATTAVVSLGIFSERDHAERRVQELKKYAVTPTITEQPHQVTTWWLDVDLAAGEATPDLALLAKTSGETGSIRAATCAAPPAPAAATPATGSKSPSVPNPPAPAASAAKLPGAPT